MKYFTIILISIITTVTIGKSIKVKGEYFDQANKKYSVTWTITNNNNKLVILHNNEIKGEIILNKEQKINKIIKYVQYKGTIKKLTITNKRLIEYELQKSILPFSYSLNYFKLTEAKYKTANKFILMSEPKK